MPNWCEGTLKIRGKKEDIVNFLKNEIEPVSSGIIKIKENQDNFSIKANSPSFYLKNTKRGFILQNEIEFYYANQILKLDYRQAWAIETKELINISKKYNIDIKIYGYEQGAEFNQDIEIHKGKIIKDEVIEFNDYEWDCSNPDIGG